MGLPIQNALSQDPKAQLIGDASFDSIAPAKTVRVLAFMEASWVTGPAKNLIEFARRAAERQEYQLRAEISIATFVRGDPQTSNEFIRACRNAGITVHAIGERHALDFAVIPAIRKLIAEHDPDIIQTHAVKSHFLAKLATMRKRRYWIAFQHGYTWTDFKMHVYNQLDRVSLPSALRVVTVCRPFAEALEKIGVRPDRIVIRHNSVATFRAPADEQLAELRRALRILPGARVLLSVGRLSLEKGHADLINAFARLSKIGSDRQLYLIFVGDGPERQPLEAQAQATGMADRVIFAGHQADVTPYYASADLMVLPSHSEGSPNVLLEAMAAGLPIVATAVGGVPEIVTDEKEALLVPKNNPSALAHAIERVLGDQILQNNLSDGAKETISAFSPAAYCDSMLSLYQDCLAEEVEHHRLSL